LLTLLDVDTELVGWLVDCHSNCAAELRRAPDGGILVNARLESVSVPGVFAAGDCCT
jgi:thioredoxin reductase